MSTENPKIEGWILARLFQRFGARGLAAAALVMAVFSIWKGWNDVVRWPGVASAVAYLTREPLPQADSDRFSVAVANLDGDSESGDGKNLILRSLRDFNGIQTLSFDRTLSVKGSVPEEQERAAFFKAQDLLKRSRATVVIWGSILHHDGESRFDLYITKPQGRIQRSRQYGVEAGQQLHLPKMFWEDLSSVLHLVVATQASQFDALEGRYVADRIEPFIGRVGMLVESGASRIDPDADSLTLTRLILADSLLLSGNQSGRTERIRQAVAIYRDVSKIWSDRFLLRAVVQGSLGDALSSLGEREAGRASLEAAVVAYRQALKELTRDLLPHRWSTLQNNLGIALSALGERETGTARLHESITAYQEALEERRRDRLPVEWGQTQANLCTALRSLGEREPGTARLKEAALACGQALEELPRDRVPLEWGAAENNLGEVLSQLGLRENSAALLERAETAHREALKELTRDRVPHEWATAQDDLGTALLRLGKLRRDTSRLEESIVAYRAALSERQRDRAEFHWSASQNNLGTALMCLGELENGTARLEEAATAYRASLSTSGGTYFASITRRNLQHVERLLVRRRHRTS